MVAGHYKALPRIERRQHPGELFTPDAHRPVVHVSETRMHDWRPPLLNAQCSHPDRLCALIHEFVNRRIALGYDDTIRAEFPQSPTNGIEADKPFVEQSWPECAS